MATTFAAQGPNARALFRELAHSPNLALLQVLNEAAGATVFDRSANRLDGTVTGTITYGTTQVGAHFNGVTFPGTNAGYITLGNVSPLSFERTNSFTLLALVTTTDIANARQLLTKTSGTVGWYWGILNTGKINLDLIAAAGTSELNISESAAISTNTTYLLGATYDGTSAPGGVVLYRDGVAKAMTTITNNLTTTILNTASVILGGDTAGGTYWSGKVAMVAVLSRAASANDMRRWAYLAGVL